MPKPKPMDPIPPLEDEPQASERVGMVLGTDPASPLSFWVAVSPDAYLQLDDAVIVDTEVPGRGTVRIAGIVQDARARHEGASFDTDVFLTLHQHVRHASVDTDVFLIDKGVLPVDTAVAAQVIATRFEPEIFVPPMPPAGLPRSRQGPGRGPVLRSDGAPGAGGAVAGRRSRLPRPGLPGRHARRPREHLGRVGRGHENDVRPVPPLRPVPLAGARPVGRQHQGHRVQREGRGPDVAGQAERQAHPGGQGRIRAPQAPGGTLRVGRPVGPGATGDPAIHDTLRSWFDPANPTNPGFDPTTS